MRRYRTSNLPAAPKHRPAPPEPEGRHRRHRQKALCPREFEVLSLLTQGMQNKEIAQRMGISDQTVKNHLTAVYLYLDVDGRVGAVLRAIALGWARNPYEGRGKTVAPQPR